MSKQSSVEYYILKLIDILGDEIINKISAEQNERIARLEKQAKDMHKQEVIDTFIDGLTPSKENLNEAEQYYKETFA